MSEERPVSMNTLRRYMLLMLVRDKESRAKGLCGISGNLTDKNQHCVVFGNDAAALSADTGKE